MEVKILLSNTSQAMKFFDQCDNFLLLQFGCLITSSAIHRWHGKGYSEFLFLEPNRNVFFSETHFLYDCIELFIETFT